MAYNDPNKVQHVFHDPPGVDPEPSEQAKTQPVNPAAFTLGGGVSPQVKAGFIGVINQYRKLMWINIVALSIAYPAYLFAMVYVSPDITAIDLAKYTVFPSLGLILINTVAYITTKVE